MQVYHIEDSLSFVVKDSYPLKQDDFLGKLILSPDRFFPDGFSGEIQLDQAGDGCEAFLKIEVKLEQPCQDPLEIQEAKEPSQEPVTGPVETEPMPDATRHIVQEEVVETKVAPTGLCC